MNHFNKLRARILAVIALSAIGTAAHAQLNGTYTVYGAGANYPTLTAAANALSAGVSGPVVFQIRPGNWTDASTSDAIIGNVSGASATNTITFEAENGNAATTIITNTNTSSSTDSNYIFHLNGAKYVRVRNLTLDKNHTTYGNVIRFAGNADYNIIENCVLTGDATSNTTNTGKSRVYGTSLTDANNNIIRNNTINAGSRSIFWEGNSTSSLSEDNEFSGNTLVNPYNYGIYTYYTENLKMLNNTLTHTGTGTFYGFYAQYADGGYQIDGNKYTGTSVTSSNYGLYLYYCDGTSTNRGSVSGNEINITSTTTVYNDIYYGNYYTAAKNKINVSNTTTQYPLRNYTGSSSYGKDVFVNENEITSVSTGGTVYVYGHYSYSDNAEFNKNKIDITTTGTVYVYGGYYYMTGGAEMNDNTIKVAGGSGSVYIYGVYYYSDGGNQFNRNNIDVKTTTGSIYAYCGYNSSINTSHAMCQYNNNKVKLVATSGNYVNNYMAYNNNSAEIMNNDIHCEAGATSYFNVYGLYLYNYNSTGKFTITNNKIFTTNTGSSGYGYVYCLFMSYVGNGSIVANNSVAAIDKGTSTYTLYGLYVEVPNGGIDIYNNSVYTQSTAWQYTFYTYSGGGSQTFRLRNNVASRSGSASGYLFYGSSPAYYDADYNNYHFGGSSVYYSPNNYTSISALRAGTNFEKNSLSYNPGYTDPVNGDLTPNASSPNSWSLNGRGVQMTGNNKDINGNARAVTTVQGVPDLGAYEFTPTATPPDCQLLPSGFPTPNAKQYALFGGDTVAVFKWGNFTPTGFAVKQYTGTEAPGLIAINPTKMFYHIDVQGTGSSLAYELDMYYKDPWLGTIASKSALRLAEKVGSNNWTGYLPANSVSNIVQNFVHTTGVNDVGALFTGIDIANNASADGIVEPKSPFCQGTYTVKARIKNNGNNVLNSVKVNYQIDAQPPVSFLYNTPININGSPQGNEAVVTLTSVTFGSAPVHIKVWTSDPNGVVDPVPVDDTHEKDYFAALNGVYTVGGTNPHFPTVVAAANALKEYGTCGTVVFNIRPGTYSGKVTIDNPIRLASPTDRVTFQAENGNASSVIITYTSTTGNDGTVKLNASYITLRKLTIEHTGASYAQGIGIYGNSSEDSILGCNIEIPTATITYTDNCGIFAYSSYTSFNGNNIAIIGNRVSGAYHAISFYKTSTPYTSGLVIDSNTFVKMYNGIYLYYTSGVKIRYNTIAPTIGSRYSAIQCNNAYDGPEIIGNRISNVYGQGIATSTFYGTNSTTNRAKIANNIVTVLPTQAAYYPFYMYYPQNADVINNTFINNGSTSTGYYGAYMYVSSYSNNNFYNNIFANLAGGLAFYAYIPTGYNNKFDYNNLYTTSTTAFSNGSYTTKDLATWRTSSKMDSFSVSYPPSFISASNGSPNVTDPKCWALNGHGVHIAGNDKDINGKPRPVNRADGVPDIGAVEFVPDVDPPLATATPATAAPGVEQVFTFAGNEVARIKWGIKAPAIPVEVRQYSGEKGSGIVAAAAPAGTMYFHTDIKPLATGNTFDYQVNVDYMDIWLGDIATDANLRLAHLVSGYPWMVYSGSLSSINATTNNLDAPNMNRFGSFSALENNSVASAFVRANGTTIICIGNSVQLTAEPNNGDNYTWMRNGTPIPGASGPNAKSYTANQAGDYSVEITFGSSGGNKIVESVPVTVSTIAAPNAIIGANKQLTYCAGNGLLLNAGSTPGLTYQWQLNGVDISGATSSVHPVQQAGNYTVVVTNIGCSTVSAVTPVTSGPLTVFLGNDTTYCEIPNVYAKLDAGYPGATYKWSTGETTQTIEVKQSGTYKVEVNGGPNCISTDEIVVTIDELPEANGISYVQNGNSYQFFPSGPTNVSGYLWIFGDGTTSNQTNPTKVITNGNVYVRLVLFNACGTDTVQLGWPLSVSKVVEGSSLQVYPNPAKDRVKVSLDGTAKLESVEILNSVGAVVYRGTVNGKEHSVDVSGLANGHYMLRATTDGGTVTRQFDVIK